MLKFFSIILLLLAQLFVEAQCPPNLNFEEGTFNGWQTYTGNVAAVANQNVMFLAPTAAPVVKRHEMLSAVPGDGIDPFGKFPVNCPNGSGHSIKLGNSTGGGQ